MSQATKCRNARRKAAKRRNWEAAQIRKSMAMQSAEVTPDPALFLPIKVNRKVCSDNVATIGRRHVDIENHYKRKILELQTIGGIQPILRETDCTHEQIRLCQENGATESR